MSVAISFFDHRSDGREIHKITLKNAAGTAVSFLDRGVTLQSFVFNGHDIVLGFDNMASYEQSSAYIGATVGRVCNRIADGRFTLNGKEYVLACNEADRHVHLHGGDVGFNQKVWDYTVVKENTDPTVEFSLHSTDGEEGYPGNLDVQVTVSLSEDNTLSFCYHAVSDQDTPVSLTNHAYYNLNGCDGEKVQNTYLQVAADEFTPVNNRLIPTGEYCPVENTPLDLRKFVRLEDVFSSTDPLVADIGGLDHNFVLSHGRRPLSDAAVAYSPATGIRLTCQTDLPGIQVYTAGCLEESSGKYGLSWGPYQGLCLETQFFPDSVNQPQFPSAILRAGQAFDSCTTYHVDQMEE